MITKPAVTIYEWRDQIYTMNAEGEPSCFVVTESGNIEPWRSDCPYDYSHTQSWCGFPQCRES